MSFNLSQISALAADLTTTIPPSDLFSVEPAVDEDTGVLTYTPKNGAEGQALITVKLEDHGGTTNGGQETDSQSFKEINNQKKNEKTKEKQETKKRNQVKKKGKKKRKRKKT